METLSFESNRFNHGISADGASTQGPHARWLFALMLAGTLLLGGFSNNARAQEAASEPSTVGKVLSALKNESTDEKAKTKPGIPTHPVDIMLEMGGWLIPFVIASVISLWFGIERIVVLRRGRVIPKAFVGRFLEHLQEGKLDSKTALKLCEQSHSPVAAVFAHGVRKWGKPSVEVEQAIIDGGERQVSQLRKHLRVLNGVATVTPLLGLLGTVIGMIQAFNDIASAGAMGQAEQLAVGIALALLTTAFGLAIAIPSLIMYMYLTGRVDALVMEMDLLSQDVVNLISAEALASRSIEAKRARVRRPARPQPESKKAV